MGSPWRAGNGGGPPLGQGTHQFMVGRQPIFDTKLSVYGYELLFRNARATGPGPNGDAMTADVLVHAGLDMGLASLVGSKRAFVNATRSFIVGRQDIPLSPRQTVVEVLEDVPRDPEVLAGCRRLVANGYTLALDDFLSGKQPDPLLELVDIVKLDVLEIAPEHLADAVMQCSAYGVRLVAEKVETREQLAQCQRLGFDLFQGYLLSRPEVLEGHSLSPSHATCLRLLQRLCEPMASASDMEEIVQTDAALSYRFLRAAGTGAARGLFRRISSVREAVVLLGERKIRAWVTLMLLAGTHEGSDEQLLMAMTRARMAELMALAMQEPDRADAAFTVGLLSALDLLLRTPLADVIAGMSLSSDVEQAVLKRTGLLGDILSDVVDWEVGNWGPHMRCGLAPGAIGECYVQAAGWAADVCELLDLGH
ncbi:MAG: EAL and HDOD domain-containing protein [Acidimicrobiales bacterium]